MAEAPEIPSRQVLAETPARVLTFLRAAGTSRLIRAALAAAGYTPADHAEGWRRLHAVSGYSAASSEPEEDTAVHDAMAYLDKRDEEIFQRIRLALHRLHPEQEAFVFADGLAPAQGTGSVLSM